MPGLKAHVLKPLFPLGGIAFEARFYHGLPRFFRHADRGGDDKAYEYQRHKHNKRFPATPGERGEGKYPKAYKSADGSVFPVLFIPVIHKRLPFVRRILFPALLPGVIVLNKLKVGDILILALPGFAFGLFHGDEAAALGKTDKLVIKSTVTLRCYGVA